MPFNEILGPMHYLFKRKHNESRMESLHFCCISYIAIFRSCNALSAWGISYLDFNWKYDGNHISYHVVVLQSRSLFFQMEKHSEFLIVKPRSTEGELD